MNRITVRLKSDRCPKCVGIRNIAWSDFADNTRWHIRQKTFDSVQDALENTIENYRRNLWDTQDVYLEFIVEKDAMASIVSDITIPFGVPLLVARGYASLTCLYNAAETYKEMIERGKRVIIYHLGDYDPAGVNIGESIKRNLANDFNVEVEFQRLAITPEQISKYDLPTRPAKKTDRLARTWKGECVELDTLRSGDIKAIVESAITQHIEQRQWEILKKTEEMERETLKQIYANN